MWGAGALAGVVLRRVVMVVVLVLAVGLMVWAVQHLATKHLRMQVHGGMLIDVEGVLIEGTAQLRGAQGIRHRQLQKRLRREPIEWEAGWWRVLQPKPQALLANLTPKC